MVWQQRWWRGILKKGKCRAITRQSIEKNNEMSEKHEDQFPLGPFLSTPASWTGGEGRGIRGRWWGGGCGTIAALSWSQIKNNYFLRLILNQEGVDTRRGCFSSEKRAAIIPPIRFLSMKYWLFYRCKRLPFIAHQLFFLKPPPSQTALTLNAFQLCFPIVTFSIPSFSNDNHNRLSNLFQRVTNSNIFISCKNRAN